MDDPPRRPAPQPVDVDGWARNKERLKEQLEHLRSDPTALDKPRNDPDFCATLMSLAQHGDLALTQALATTYLAFTFPNVPAVETFLFGRLFDARIRGRQAALHGYLANYGDDDRAIRTFVAGIADLSPGPIADLLDACFEWHPLLGEGPFALLPTGITKEAWMHWTSAARSARLPLLTRRDLQTLLFAIMRRDPDGPVERVLERISRDLGSLQLKPRWVLDLLRQPSQPASVDPAYIAGEKIGRDLSEKIAALHPRWHRIEDYVQEFDTVGKRRLRGWKRDLWMFDLDFEWRQERVAARMAQFPDAIALRRAFEDMLVDRPPLFPRCRDEGDYYQFEPMGWRRVAWATLTGSHWTVDEAVDFARRIVDLGPWDEEKRKSKEAIEAVARSWPTEERVLVFLAETERRADVGAFVHEDIARLLKKAQAGENIRLDRRGS